MSDFGERLEAALKKRGIQAKDLAATVGIAKQSITSIKKGRMSGGKHTPAIAQALGVSVEWLTTGDPTHAPAWAKVATPPPPATPANTMPPMPEALAARIAQVLGMTPVEVRAWGSTRSGLDSMTATLNALALHDDLLKERAARERAEAALAAERQAVPPLASEDPPRRGPVLHKPRLPVNS